MRLNVNTRMLRLGLLAICLSVTAFGTLAQQPDDSGLNSTPAIQSPSSTPVSDIRSLQQALAAAEYYKNRAEAAERSRDEWKAESATWKGLFLDERKRSELLLSANTDRKEAGASTNYAVSLLKQQVDDDRDRMNQLSDQLKACQASKIKYAIGGGLIGLGVGTFGRR